MNLTRTFLVLFAIVCLNFSAMADNHSKKEEVVDKAKEITKKLQEDGLDEVPLNDPFAGNEGTTSANANVPEEEQQDQFSLYNYKLSGLISGTDHSYISLVDSSGEFTTLTLGQNLGKVKLIDLRLTEAIFEKEDKSFLIIDFNNIVREANEY